MKFPTVVKTLCWTPDEQMGLTKQVYILFYECILLAGLNLVRYKGLRNSEQLKQLSLSKALLLKLYILAIHNMICDS